MSIQNNRDNRKLVREKNLLLASCALIATTNNKLKQNKGFGDPWTPLF